MSENNIVYLQFMSDLDDIYNTNSSVRDKYIHLRSILERILKTLTQEEVLQFPSLFSRLVFVSQKYKLPYSLEKQLHTVRIKSSHLLRSENNIVSESDFVSAKSIIESLLDLIYNCKLQEKRVGETLNFIKENTNLNKKYTYSLRVEVIDIDGDKEIITAQSDDVDSKIINIKYNDTKHNEIFNTSVNKLWIGAQLNIIDFKINNKGYYIPNFIVLEPDFLLDVSAVAECFQNYGYSHLHHIRKRFEQVRNSQHILLGNLANFFLDELIFAENADELSFDEVFLEAFKQKPFEFASCNDIKEIADFKLFMVKSQAQFSNIKRVITNDFKHNKISVHNCILEPSFFCEKFGFQGRLDLFQMPNNEDELYKIIELKSGGLPFPKSDMHKIAINHEVQTAIYKLIIQTVFNKSNRDISSAILYSAAENTGENLRFAAPYQQLDKQIINLRNNIVAIEYQLYTGGIDAARMVFEDIVDLDNYGKVPDFVTNQVSDFEKTIRNLSELEQLYFFRFISFISRELYIQKIGSDNYTSNTSVASLWNTEFAEREESFDLISNLEIESIDYSGRDMKIFFKRGDCDNFSNFRVGEVCILYPRDAEDDTALNNQIFKGNIAELSATHILLRFRYKQKNIHIFSRHKLWVIEHDRLDHAYTSMYKSIFAFIKSPIEKRELLLGVKEPRYYEENSINKPFEASNKQDIILKRAIAAQDYFLIVGPPGTGKTSIFARRLVEHYFNNTSSNVLIIAYTNRAVDELCEAVNQIFDCQNGESDKYIRIGTELSCGEKYRHRLLQNLASNVQTRAELRQIIHSQRIYIGTLASIVGKPELFDLKDFDVAIIDEASQILEPQIMGILPKVEKFIMIGDHKQLSTITLQTPAKSEVSDTFLNSIELYNCNESLFERLYRLCSKNSWNAYDTLTHQGRMHQEIAHFPNQHFYENRLYTVSGWQNEALSLKTKDINNLLKSILANNRMGFFNVETSSENWINDKINNQEANIVIEICKNIVDIYTTNKLIFDSDKTIGIITPYRNQIALIKHKLAETNINQLQDIMVDTVERYQGSQRDIIIISFSMNKPYQLDFFSNMNLDGTVDRKLNVALTRARQQLFLVGNKEILAQNQLYKDLINQLPQFSI